MPVTEVSQADRAAIFAEVDRLTESAVLHGSEALCRLLRYLAEQFLAHPGVPVKEYQLAIEVFGRPADFDPRLDSTVRVQTGRLRSKVAEYYASAGVTDPIILDIPKGSYSLGFHHRAIGSESSRAAPTAAVHSVMDRGAFTPGSPHRQSSIVWILAGVSALLAVALSAVWMQNRPVKVAVASAQPVEAILRFWAPFIQTQDRPWVIFSNAEFVGRPQDGIRYFDPARDSRSGILDHYTGVGEVLGVAELSRVFTQLHHEIRIKRGRLLALDDVKNNDVIFLGSPAENLTLREIPTTQDFVFRRIDGGARRGDTEIVNVHPRPDEPALFVASGTLPLVEDYGLIGLVPGINPLRWILVLAGTTTMGTQAAAEFVSREHSLKMLLDRIPAHSAEITPFEAVIRVRVSGGVPVNSTIVALHAGK